jgi:hypothetical protein
MLRFAILKATGKTEDGQTIWFPVFTDDSVKRELASRVRRILGPKKSHTGEEVERAICKAFEGYKKDFKAQTVKLK